MNLLRASYVLVACVPTIKRKFSFLRTFNIFFVYNLCRSFELLKCNLNNSNFTACYIEIDDDFCRREDEEYVEWANLPDLLLEQIFSYLSISER